MGPVGHFLNRTIVPRSLFWRSILIVVLPLVFLQIVLTAIFYNRHWDTVTRWLASGVAGEVAVIIDELELAGTHNERQLILDRFRLHTELSISLEPEGRLADVTTGTGTVGIGGALSHIDNKIVESFQEKLHRPFAVDLRSEMPARVIVYVQLDQGLLRVLAPRKRVTSTTTQLLLFWMVGASLVLITIAIYFLRLQVRPIRQLAKAVDRFGKGRDPGDFTPRGPAEIRLAARAYNNMRARIIRHVSQRTEMLAAISHDLRTPLTRMKLELEMLPDRDGMVQGLRSDVDDMIDLIETYLAFVRGEEGELTEDQPLQPLIEEMCHRAGRAGRRVFVSGDETISLPLRPKAFRRCLANLVDNACRHADTLSISTKKTKRYVAIAIGDDGPGIPVDLHDQVLQPFVRLEDSRHKDTGGTGLGLTIANDIVLSHGGDLRLGQSEMGGLLVTVRLPV